MRILNLLKRNSDNSTELVEKTKCANSPTMTIKLSADGIRLNLEKVIEIGEKLLQMNFKIDLSGRPAAEFKKDISKNQ
ncbi:MAG: hypothetical protein KAR20_13505 [Candidatus Heimdallarchaeota archaeon]|nr:hypothetical protein [Candidatus Heimdallarchaeota archaeon]